MSNQFERCFSPPSRAYFEKVRVDGPLRGGALIPVSVASVEGHWSNLDVYLVATTAAFAAGNTLTVFAREGATRYPLVVVNLGMVTLVEVGGGQSRALAASVRGHPCDGFEVEVALAAAAEVQTSLEMWGTESVPDVGGEALGDAMRNGRFPQRASHGMVFDNALGVWVRQRGTAAGGAAVLATPAPATVANWTSVADTAASTTLLVANANRLGVSIHNASTEILFLLCSDALPATTTQYTARVVPNALWELPAGVRYTGGIVGVWAADAAGQANITEYVTA